MDRVDRVDRVERIEWIPKRPAAMWREGGVAEKKKTKKSGGHGATKAGPKKKTKKTGHVSLNLNMM